MIAQNMLEFKKIEIEDLEIYKEYLKNTKELSCENSFVNLLVWQSAYHNMIAVSDGQLIIKSGKKGNETFKLPFGDDFEKGLFLIKEYCNCETPRIWAQEGPNFERFKSEYENIYKFEEHRDAFDYIYLQSDLAELKGKKYHSKRNHINAFSKKHSWRYEKIDDSNIENVKLCAEEWYKENGEKADGLMLHEKKGLETMFQNLNRLGLLGGAVFVDEKAVAFTLGSKINDEIFDIHIEKALKDYAEAYTVINQQFAKNELSNFKYINREDDLGLEGLRKAKLSLKPCILLKKYLCYGETDE